ncbi:efflux RND transporter periplasmic adaptor subunit [Rhodospirillum sp. A1_3_36]|uniref:efflux RND transporter periplasmic adaptor subunit n=1 Tax=Rhodospirillum sp. A1_3_36 TaxID=3391666 RepID=UPI0039A4F1AD
MTKTRQIVVVMVLLAAVAGVFYGEGLLFPQGDGKAASRAERPIPVETVAVTTTRLADRVEAVGTTRAHLAVDIVPVADGRVTELAFAPGARVEANQVLVRLDDGAEQADLEEAEAALLQANQALTRGRALRSGKNIAQSTVDELANAQAGALARVDRARKALSDRVIIAPFSGVVGFHEVEVGARVESGQMITTLDDLAVVEVDFSVPEIHYGDLHPGLAVRATTQAYPDRVFEGVVDRVDTRVGDVSRAFRVRASLPNPEGLLPSGLFVNVDVILTERDVPTIPEEAILAEAAGSVVFVVKDGRASRRPIVTGARADGRVEVREGLEEGEDIVRLGIHRMRDGVLVSRVGETTPKG